MTVICGCQVIAKIYQSPSSTVYRAVRLGDQLPVILKVLNENYPSPQEIIRYQQEYKLTISLKHIEGVINVYSLDRHLNTFVMVLEDFGADSLSLLMTKKYFEIGEVLNIAVKICDVMAEIHAAQIIHKDINPSNIVYNGKTEKLKIIDFGIASTLSRENPQALNADALEGTLAYISPEQTGRMNRSLDYRSDFYSFGATLYELLTGQVPFPATDPSELLHCHIALEPKTPSTINPSIPEMITAITMKLLAKGAEDRYQSAAGIKTDLQECLSQIRSKGQIMPFNLAAKDMPQRLDLPEKLYGRESQILALMKAFDNVTDGNKQVVFVSGAPGVGKTSLLREIYKPLSRGKGRLISGKFDQLQRSIPYSALVSATRELVKQLLTEQRSELRQWRDQIKAALEPVAQVLVDLIPELELVIGPQPQAPNVGLDEAQNRFKLLLQNFLRIFCKDNQPLVLLLDDLQWADISTINLLKWLIEDEKLEYLLVIGTYRDNEVTPTHPLWQTLRELNKKNRNIFHIQLQPLNSKDILDLCTDAFRISKESIVPLANLIANKTGGNAFHLKEFLKTLYTKGLLAFDHLQGIWHWNLQEIQASSVTDNVTTMMADRIQRFDDDTQEILKIAACMGSWFDLATLAMIRQKGQREILDLLWPAMAEELLLPLDNSWKLVGLEIPEAITDVSVEFKFCHDRVRQAAYSLIPESDKEDTHLQIGRLLLNNTPPSELEDRIFDITNQLNHALSLIRSTAESKGLAKLNLKAGKLAKRSTAYGIALDYFRTAIELFQKDAWSQDYSLLLELHSEAVEAAYLLGDFKAMQQLADTVISKGKTSLDKTRTIEVLILSQIARNSPLQAINTALPVLRELGVHFPSHPRKVDILLAFLRTEMQLLGTSIEDLSRLPIMDDAKTLAVMRISSKISSASYIAVPELFPLIICKQVRLSLRQGISLASTFASYGLLLCGIFGAVERGYRFGRVAITLADSRHFVEERAKSYFIVNTFITHHKEHVRNTLPKLKHAYESGIQTGDLEFAAYATTAYIYNAYFMGKPLFELESEITLYCQISRELKQEGAYNHKHLYQQAIAYLTSFGNGGDSLTSGQFDEPVMLAGYQQMKDLHAIANLYFLKLQLCYLFGNHRDAIANAGKLKNYLNSLKGFFTYAEFYFYDSLANLALFREASKEEQSQLKRLLNRNQKKMEKFARHAPMNYLHKYHLVEAERHLAFGDHHQAIENYDRAIALAKEHGYLQDEALANELCARYYLARGKTSVGRAYLLDAKYGYEQWGAKAKLAHMGAVYHEYLENWKEPAPASSEEIVSVKYTVTDFDSKELDFQDLLRASQSLSEEIILNRLITHLVRLMIKNAGAERCVLVLEFSGNLLIEAEGLATQEEIITDLAIPVEDHSILPRSLIHYVARTKQNILIEDASKELFLTKDPYLLEVHPKSILCLPLMNQGVLIGMVYLENNQTVGAFAAERIEVLKVLCSQAAISIKTAKLYKELKNYTEQLKVAEQKYRSIFENAVMGIVHSAADGTILRANSSAARILGFASVDEFYTAVQDIRIELYAIPTDQTKLAHILREDGQVVGFETQFKCKTGDLCWVSLSARDFFDDAGNLSYRESSFYDISQRKLAEQELSLYQEKLRQLAIEAAMAEERERRNIAEDLHDGAIQTLAMSAFRLKNLQRFANVDNKEAELAEIIQLLDGSLKDIRSLTFELSPPVLYDYGLEAALEWLAGYIQEQHGLSVLFYQNATEPNLPEKLQVALYRAARELMINVVKHAQATEAEVSMSIADDEIAISVSDNGVGFDKNRMQENPQQYGLFSIRERMKLLGGELKIDSQPACGSRVTIRLPLAQ